MSMHTWLCRTTALVAVAVAGLASPARADDALLPSPGDYRPTAIYFGSYRRNEPLADHQEQWTFVRDHADGLLLHFGFWLNNDYHADPIGTARKLAPILRDAKLKTLIEVGFPSADPTPETTADMGRVAGGKFVEKIQRLERESGLHVDEIECELRLDVFSQVAARFPTWTADEIVQQITGRAPASSTSRATRAYWPDFIKAVRDGLGDRPIDVGCPPVYVPWKGLFTAAHHFDFKHPADVGTDGKPTPTARRVQIDAPEFWTAILSPDTAGFVCDSPWYLMANNAYDAQGYLKKVVDFERFVHARGKRFSFIANNGVDRALPAAEWDATYLRDSMSALTTFQLNGGRADRYVLESWYVGPYAIVPEDRPDTFTNLVKAAILYLKGPGERLTLSAPRPADAAGSIRIDLTNAGDVAALPAIRVKGATGGAKVAIDGVDKTATAFSAEGATPDALLAPGTMMTITIAPGEAGELAVEAMWNPQDPSNAPRASVAVHAPAK